VVWSVGVGAYVSPSFLNRSFVPFELGDTIIGYN
jgi:hypothetical protein